MKTKKKRILARGTILGTVFSGDALSTTLFNTNRVLAYIDFAASLAGLTEN
jgi:hypothetical protein